MFTIRAAALEVYQALCQTNQPLSLTIKYYYHCKTAWNNSPTYWLSDTSLIQWMLNCQIYRRYRIALTIKLSVHIRVADAKCSQTLKLLNILQSSSCQGGERGDRSWNNPPKRGGRNFCLILKFRVRFKGRQSVILPPWTAGQSSGDKDGRRRSKDRRRSAIGSPWRFIFRLEDPLRWHYIPMIGRRSILLILLLHLRPLRSTDTHSHSRESTHGRCF